MDDQERTQVVRIVLLERDWARLNRASWAHNPRMTVENYCAMFLTKHAEECFQEFENNSTYKTLVERKKIV